MKILIVHFNVIVIYMQSYYLWLKKEQWSTFSDEYMNVM